jgi:hypothetical protein
MTDFCTLFRELPRLGFDPLAGADSPRALEMRSGTLRGFSEAISDPRFGSHLALQRVSNNQEVLCHPLQPSHLFVLLLTMI